MNPIYLKVTAVDNTKGNGGQHTGQFHGGVTVEHIPTGLKAFCDQGRSQLKNKHVAVAMIEYGLAEIGWEEPGTLPGLELEVEPLKKPVPRKRNPAFDALAVVGGGNLIELTKSAAGIVAKALAEIEGVSKCVTSEEIKLRAAQYKRLHPQWDLTPTALAKHWASLGSATAVNPWAGCISGTKS